MDSSHVESALIQAATVFAVLALLVILPWFMCFIAGKASGGRASRLWGLLGPIGWIIAALRGVQERIDDVYEQNTPRARRRMENVLAKTRKKSGADAG